MKTASKQSIKRPAHTPLAVACMIAFASTTTAHAQTQATTPQRVDRVEVTGRNAEEQSPDLDKKSDGASRLGLTIRETPASIDVIGQDVMTRRGARTFDEALSGAVGVTAGGNPGSPSVVSTRGFTGAFVNFLYDGDRVSQSSMSSRSQDSFNYDRIEVLKGAASMIFGDGGVGGSVNFVTKRPDRNRTGSEALISYGSYESLRAGVGTGGAFGSGAYRIDVSHNRRDGGWIDRNGQQLTHLTSGLNFTLTPTLSLDISLDYLKDDIESYWGTPLVPLAFATEATGAVTDASGRVLDRRIARNNYNVEDGVMKADSAWLRAKLSWKASDAWTLQNQFSYYSADRDWRNAEGAVFTAPNRINRGLVNIVHDHDVLTYRFDAAHRGMFFGLPSRSIVGVEYSKTNFGTNRRFSDSSAATVARWQVDALNPQVGRYLTDASLFTGAGNRTDFGSAIDTASVFVENQLKVLTNLSLLTGLRYERIALDRTIQDLNTGVSSAFGTTYKPTSLRIGGVFDLSKNTSMYAQYADTAAPVGTSLLLSAANATFPLTRGKQTEVGLKQSIGQDFDWTLALYDIEQNNVLSRDANNPAITVNNGKIGSRGVEIAAAWRATRSLTFSGNIAMLNAEFKNLIEAGNVSRVGNVPTNVPEKTANAWIDYRFAGLPVSIGAGANWVGKRFTNNANTVAMNAYTTLDAYVTWRAKPVDLTLRVRNATDKFYATWSGSSANNQVLVGAPRTVELTAKIEF